MTDKYDKLKSNVLPKAVLEHFNQARETFEKNKKILERVGKPVDFATTGENSLLKIITELAKRNEHSLNVIFTDMELAYVSDSLLRKKIKNIEKILNQQGKEFDEFYDKHEEGLQFLDNYINHNLSKEDNDG